MNKTKYAWKVVDCVDGKLVSSSETGVMMKRYYLNRFVKRCKEYGPLCLFRTLKSARKYCKNMSGVPSLRIFKAEYIPSEKELFCSPFHGTNITKKYIYKMYREVYNGIQIDDFVTAESVKLLKEFPK